MFTWDLEQKGCIRECEEFEHLGVIIYKEDRQEIYIPDKITKCRVQETNLGLNMNSIHQILSYADDVNLISDDITTIERIADVLLNA